MPTPEQLRAMTPDQRAAVYRRRRLGVGLVAVALVVAMVWLVGAVVGGDDTSSTATTTTVPAAQSGSVGSCRPPADPRRLVAELVMVGVDPTDPAAAVAMVAAHPDLGGVFVGGDSGAVLGSEEFRRATGDADLLVAIDDEGGRVQRLDYLAGPLASARTLGRTRTAAQITELAAARAQVMQGLGVNVDFAPVADVSTQAAGDVIGDRSFGGDAETVTTAAGAFAAGLRRAGVLPVLKHFPGHGHASGDSHEGAVLTPKLSDLQRVDLVPFRRLVTTTPVGVMVGHLDVPGLTETGRPASLSPAAYRLLRDDVGFDGLAVTDDLAGMASVGDRFPPPEAAEAAIVAGADLAVVSSLTDPAPVIDRLVEALAAGRLPQARATEAWNRVVTAKVAVGAASCDD